MVYKAWFLGFGCWSWLGGNGGLPFAILLEHSRCSSLIPLFFYFENLVM